MARTIRVLVFSAFLLVIPSGAIPPALHLCPGSLSCRTIGGQTVLIRKYLIWKRLFHGNETKPHVQIYNITVINVLVPVAPDRMQPLTDTSNPLAMNIHEVCPSEAQEVAHGTANHRALPPMP